MKGTLVLLRSKSSRILVRIRRKIRSKIGIRLWRGPASPISRKQGELSALIRHQQAQYHATVLLKGKVQQGLATKEAYDEHRRQVLADIQGGRVTTAQGQGRASVSASVSGGFFDGEWPSLTRAKLLFLQDLMEAECISDEEYHYTKSILLHRLAEQGAEVDARDFLIPGPRNGVPRSNHPQRPAGTRAGGGVGAGVGGRLHVGASMQRSGSYLRRSAQKLRGGFRGGRGGEAGGGGGAEAYHGHTGRRSRNSIGSSSLGSASVLREWAARQGGGGLMNAFDEVADESLDFRGGHVAGAHVGGRARGRGRGRDSMAAMESWEEVPPLEYPGPTRAPPSRGAPQPSTAAGHRKEGSVIQTGAETGAGATTGTGEGAGAGGGTGEEAMRGSHVVKGAEGEEEEQEGEEEEEEGEDEGPTQDHPRASLLSRGGHKGPYESVESDGSGQEPAPSSPAERHNNSSGPSSPPAGPQAGTGTNTAAPARGGPAPAPTAPAATAQPSTGGMGLGGFMGWLGAAPSPWKSPFTFGVRKKEDALGAHRNAHGEQGQQGQTGVGAGARARAEGEVEGETTAKRLFDAPSGRRGGEDVPGGDRWHTPGSPVNSSGSTGGNSEQPFAGVSMAQPGQLADGQSGKGQRGEGRRKREEGIVVPPTPGDCSVNVGHKTRPRTGAQGAYHGGEGSMPSEGDSDSEAKYRKEAETWNGHENGKKLGYGYEYAGDQAAGAGAGGTKTKRKLNDLVAGQAEGGGPAGGILPAHHPQQQSQRPGAAPLSALQESDENAAPLLTGAEAPRSGAYMSGAHTGVPRAAPSTDFQTSLRLTNLSSNGLAKSIKQGLRRLVEEICQEDPRRRTDPSTILSSSEMESIAQRMPADKAELLKMFPRKWVDAYGPQVLSVVRAEVARHVDVLAVSASQNRSSIGSRGFPTPLGHPGYATPGISAAAPTGTGAGTGPGSSGVPGAGPTGGGSSTRRAPPQSGTSGVPSGGVPRANGSRGSGDSQGGGRGAGGATGAPLVLSDSGREPLRVRDPNKPSAEGLGKDRAGVDGAPQGEGSQVGTVAPESVPGTGPGARPSGGVGSTHGMPRAGSMMPAGAGARVDDSLSEPPRMFDSIDEVNLQMQGRQAGQRHAKGSTFTHQHHHQHQSRYHHHQQQLQPLQEGGDKGEGSREANLGAGGIPGSGSRAGRGSGQGTDSGSLPPTRPGTGDGRAVGTPVHGPTHKGGSSSRHGSPAYNDNASGTVTVNGGATPRGLLLGATPHSAGSSGNTGAGAGSADQFRPEPAVTPPPPPTLPSARGSGGGARHGSKGSSKGSGSGSHSSARNGALGRPSLGSQGSQGRMTGSGAIAGSGPGTGAAGGSQRTRLNGSGATVGSGSHAGSQAGSRGSSHSRMGGSGAGSIAVSGVPSVSGSQAPHPPAPTPSSAGGGGHGGVHELAPSKVTIPVPQHHLQQQRKPGGSVHGSTRGSGGGTVGVPGGANGQDAHKVGADSGNHPHSTAHTHGPSLSRGHSGRVEEKGSPLVQGRHKPSAAYPLSAKGSSAASVVSQAPGAAGGAFAAPPSTPKAALAAPGARPLGSEGGIAPGIPWSVQRPQYSNVGRKTGLRAIGGLMYNAGTPRQGPAPGGSGTPTHGTPGAGGGGDSRRGYGVGSPYANGGGNGNGQGHGMGHESVNMGGGGNVTGTPGCPAAYQSNIPDGDSVLLDSSIATNHIRPQDSGHHRVASGYRTRVQ